MVSRPAILGRQRQTRGNKAARLRRCPRAQRESGRTRVRNDPATGSRMDGRPRHTEPRHRAHDRRHREVPRRVIRLGGRCPAGTGAEVRSPGTRRLGRSAWKGAPRAPAREKPPADAWAAIRRASEAVFAPGAPFLSYLGPKRLCSSDGDRTCHSPCPLTDLDIRAQLCRV